MVEARPGRRERSRCGICGRRSPGYDGGEGRRRWRALDLGATRAFVEAKAPRVACKRHGVVVVRVPWARHGSRFTRPFEAQVAWLASYCSKSAVCELMRVSWLSVGRMIERVVADEQAKRGDRLERLRRIGIDELSYRKGQRYITGVVDHDTGRLVWAADGRDKKTVASFFAELGPERTGRIELVSSDMGEWITRVVARECPQATLCLDPFHVVKLASAALGRGPPRGLERRPPRRRPGRRALAERGALGALEAAPAADRTPTSEAGHDRAGQPPAVPGLPLEGAAAARLPRA